MQLCKWWTSWGHNSSFKCFGKSSIGQKSSESNIFLAVRFDATLVLFLLLVTKHLNFGSYHHLNGWFWRYWKKHKYFLIVFVLQTRWRWYQWGWWQGWSRVGTDITCIIAICSCILLCILNFLPLMMIEWA